MKQERKPVGSKTVEDFVADAYYDKDGQQIRARQNGEATQLIADVRGWGAIQNLFPLTEDGQKEAAVFQDKLGEFIANAINKAAVPPNMVEPRREDILMLLDALRDIDLYEDVSDPPMSAERLADFARKAVKSFFEKYPNYTLLNK